MGRRRQRRRSGGGRPADPPGVTPPVSIETVVEWQGEPWVVRPIRGSSSTRSYRCPGCDQLIRPGHTAHGRVARDRDHRRGR